ncbi:LamG-like jellyroll fold domain-containing protein [Streptomyces sp. NPDC001450]
MDRVGTSKSCTVSAWTHLTNTTGYATVAGESGTAVSSFHPQYSKAFNAWTFVSPPSDGADPSACRAAFASTPPALNTWTHLAGVQDANTQTMSPYVNGTVVSAVPNGSAWPATGSLAIGNAKNENPFPGRIRDVQAWQPALPDPRPPSPLSTRVSSPSRSS